MSEKRCPCCGSIKIEDKKETITKKLSDNSIVEFDGVNNICLDCGEEGDFFGVNDKLFLLAKDKENKRFFSSMLDAVKSKGFSLAYMERVLNLPQRTLTRWKNQGVSASGVALMKFVNTYPWLLKVADKKFDPSYAQRELIQQAAISFSNSLSEVGGVAKGVVIAGGQSAIYSVDIFVPTPESDTDIISPIEIDTNVIPRHGT